MAFSGGPLSYSTQNNGPRQVCSAHQSLTVPFHATEAASRFFQWSGNIDFSAMSSVYGHYERSRSYFFDTLIKILPYRLTVCELTCKTPIHDTNQIDDQ